MNYHLPIQHGARGDRGSHARFHRRDDLVRLFAAGIGGDAYPSRRITFVVPYPAGGATDVSARLLANKLQEAWKQTVVVENKSGGGGVVGNDYVAKAQPDGYTVLIAITQIIQAPSLVAKLPYDVFKDLAPVTQVGAVDHRSDGPRAAADQVGQGTGRSTPRRIPAMPYGTFGNATTSHLYGELLKKVADIDMTHVPYRGSAPLTNDLLANTVTSAFVDLTTASAQIKAGKLRALAVGGEKRRTAVARRADARRTRLSRF